MNTMPKRAFHGGTNAVTSSRSGMSQFEISKRIYSSGILSRIELSMSAKLVLIALANHYNPEKKRNVSVAKVYIRAGWNQPKVCREGN